MDEAFGTATRTAIEAAWTSWGRLDQDVIAPLINPAFMGGPAWPGLRQAYSITRRTDALLLASSGLADPTTWDDDDATNGFKVEMYAIASDLPVDSDTTTVAGLLGTQVTTMVKTRDERDGQFDMAVGEGPENTATISCQRRRTTSSTVLMHGYTPGIDLHLGNRPMRGLVVSRARHQTACSGDRDGTRPVRNAP